MADANVVLVVQITYRQSFPNNWANKVGVCAYMMGKHTNSNRLWSFNRNGAFLLAFDIATKSLRPDIRLLPSTNSIQCLRRELNSRKDKYTFLTHLLQLIISKETDNYSSN